jgi:hypothetical protein
MFGLPCINCDLKPVKFHPYTSRVLNRLFEVDCDSEELQKCYRDLENELLRIFKRTGIEAWTDNKIVFEFEDKGTPIFYGFYDWRFSVGLSYHDENERR